ncbi:hypothetical protein [Cerasicoccus frondis]|nr:hypothetical protein [Cerasicoccus frondis]
MKGKRYTTEQKICILRSADQEGVSIQDACVRQASANRVSITGSASLG